MGSASATTNASGVALTTWTVDVGGATVQSDGTFPNTLTATVVQGSGPSTAFSGSAIYSYVTDVDPLWSAGCSGCHASQGGPPDGGLSLAQLPADNYLDLVDIVAGCGGGLARVNSSGGVNAADVLSVLLRINDPDLPNAGTCSHPFLYASGAPQLDIIRAWIRNTALNN